MKSRGAWANEPVSGTGFCAAKPGKGEIAHLTWVPFSGGPRVTEGEDEGVFIFVVAGGSDEVMVLLVDLSCLPVNKKAR